MAELLDRYPAEGRPVTVTEAVEKVQEVIKELKGQ
jgi:hypothetical protein